MLSEEYLLWFAVGVLLLLIFGGLLIQYYRGMVTAPKIDIDVIRSTVVRKPNGVYFEFVLQFRTNTRVCVNYVELYDPSTNQRIVIGDKDSGELSNLPVCSDPYVVFTLGGYQSTTSGFSPGTKVMVSLHYDTSTYDPDNPQKIIFFATITSS